MNGGDRRDGGGQEVWQGGRQAIGGDRERRTSLSKDDRRGGNMLKSEIMKLWGEEGTNKP